MRSQSNQVSGTVVEASTGQTLPGVNILVKGKTRGTSTRTDGTFTIEVESLQDTLIFSYIGFKSQQIPLNGRTSLDIQLESSSTNLNEMVVVGYSSQQKKDVLGSIATADIEALQNFPTPNVKSMIEGRIPGVNVLGNNAPGGEGTIRIRGYTTIRDSDPLYVIDGIPTTSGLNKVNPFDIESIQVLKDAASASIYGSRSANGVVLVTTKKGQTEAVRLTLNAFSGVQSVFNLPEMTGAREYGQALWQAMRNDGSEPSSGVYGNGATPEIPQWLDDEQTILSANINWPDEIFEVAPMQSYNVGLSKGDDSSKQYFSLGYFDQQGTLRYTGYQRVTARFNSEYTLFDRFTIGENLGGSYERRTSAASNSILGNVIFSSYEFPSITPVYKTTGDFAGNPLNDTQNPLGQLYRNKDNTDRQLSFLGNTYVDWELFDNVNIRSNLGVDYYTYNLRNFNPAYQELLTQRGQSSLTTTSNYGYNWVWSNTLNASRNFGHHQVELLVGTEAIKNYTHNFYASRTGFPSTDHNFRYLSAGSTENQINSGTAAMWSLFSQFGKLNYSFDDRYLAAFTIRNDGTSRLDENRYSVFPAFSLGWRISEEPFLKSDFINDMKLRFSWGQNGNQNVPPYSTIESYSSNANYSNYPMGGGQTEVTTGFTQTRNGNPNLTWEETTQTNIGLDMTVWEARLAFSVDYFSKQTDGLLINRSLVPSVGGTNQTLWDNVGEMENRGLEFVIDYYSPDDQAFTYSFGVNGSFIENELTSLPDDINYLGLSSSELHTINFDQEISRSDEGQPISSFFGHVVDGIFQDEQEVRQHGAQPNAQPGDFRFQDINKDGVINSDDRTFIGSPLPDFSFGVNLQANWKGWDFAAFIDGVIGNEVYDLTRFSTDFFNQASYNKHERVLNAWTPQNTDTNLPRLSLNDPNNNVRPSSYYVSDASYVRLSNIQLGYSIPGLDKWTGKSSNLRIYGQVQNLLTVTGYEGLNPAVGLRNNIDIGVDRGIYPPSRIFSLGLNLTL